jgi:hypothetical protein
VSVVLRESVGDEGPQDANRAGERLHEP